MIFVNRKRIVHEVFDFIQLWYFRCLYQWLTIYKLRIEIIQLGLLLRAKLLKIRMLLVIRDIRSQLILQLAQFHLLLRGQSILLLENVLELVFFFGG